jgi:hypothetical protein
MLIHGSSIDNEMKEIIEANPNITVVKVNF